MKLKSQLIALLLSGILLTLSFQANSQDVLSPADLLQLESMGGLELNPVKDELIFSVSTPRGPNEDPGGSRIEYFRDMPSYPSPVPLFSGDVQGRSPQYSPDGEHIGFLYAENGKATQVWVMDASGSHMKKLTQEESGVSSFKWQPGKKGIAYLSSSSVSARENELKKRGYDFIYYEENLLNNHLHMAWFDDQWKQISTWQLTDGANAWDFEFNHQGTQLAVTLSPQNLIDHSYMFRRIYLIDLETGHMKQVSQNEGKLGNYVFSPNGKYLAYAAALNINDHAVSQAFVIDLNSGSISNLSPEKFRGHVSWVNWKDDEHVLFHASEGVYPTLNTIPVKGGKRKIVLNGAECGIIFSPPRFDSDFQDFVFTGSTPGDYINLYRWDGKNDPEKISKLNPVLQEKKLGKQEVISYQARDGQVIEGILIHPVDYEAGKSYPLIVYVHGGPESHHSNGWLSSYGTPGQVMAGKGYLVLYLNYRASTGYGVDFGMEGFMDPAGTEFDDIADGIEWAIRDKGADPERVGLAGGSYGGYASGWFATYYTRYVKAVCMFVGISNNISKRGTTDIPYEELYVHSGKKLEEQWQLDLERSPIYWAHQSKTATLIYGGAADTRVHPSQSFELYRRMKMNDHPAVRLVQYPGEGHGNSKQVGQIDVLYRQMEWFDWYVKDLHPLDGPMPRLDVSDRYGLDWNYTPTP
ncbi:MAG: S9 family peptidase [Bacteroidia bacterium]|nr:MAG: S9 family peptidase [Bacteroidia bacterium]